MKTTSSSILENLLWIPFDDNPVYIYEFSESRKMNKTEELFKDYKGYLVCDKYAGYDKFKDKLLGIQRCMAHARAKLQ